MKFKVGQEVKCIANAEQLKAINMDYELYHSMHENDTIKEYNGLNHVKSFGMPIDTPFYLLESNYFMPESYLEAV